MACRRIWSILFNINDSRNKCTILASRKVTKHGLYGDIPVIGAASRDAFLGIFGYLIIASL